jgi:2-keto-4-pentenoate hydratase/2-oxohepta-3-ene-1,7-dioic acid hydratase in catechol pathway
MKFARYEHQGTTADGVLGDGDRLHRLPVYADIDALIRHGGRAALLAAGETALGKTAPGPSVGDVRLLPPLHPASIRDSVSFEAHIEGVRRAQEGAHDPVPEQWYSAPCFYFTNPHAGIGAFDDVERFPGAQQFDLELEVGVVYGAHGRNLTPRETSAAIVGYTIFNDWSARDIQRTEGRLPFGFFKGKDGAHTIGPYLVTADELEPHKTDDGLLDLTMRAWINGELLGEDSLANCAFTFEELISFASRGAAVAPGDLLASGTCQRGCLAEVWGRADARDSDRQRVPPPLAPGDVVTLEVEGIGRISNRVVDPAPFPEIPTARRGQPRGPRH